MAHETLKLLAWIQWKSAMASGIAILAALSLVTSIVLQAIPPSIEGCFVHASPESLNKAPNLVVVRPTQHPNQSYLRVLSGDRFIGRNIGMPCLFSMAFNHPANLILFESVTPAGRYDVLQTATNGSKTALQARVAKELGLTARFEKRVTNILSLEIANPSAPGLKPTRSQHGFVSIIVNGDAGFGELMVTNQPVSTLALMIGDKVVDHTGITNNIDAGFRWNLARRAGETMDPMHQALLEQAGLKLVARQETVEMLVVRRTDL
jgi:uncharacterized protein (TIGR03435 family)